MADVSLINTADLVAIGGGGSQPFGGSHFFRVVGPTTRQIVWIPAHAIRLRGMWTTLLASLVVSRSAWTSNALDGLADGSELGGGEVLYWNNLAGFSDNLTLFNHVFRSIPDQEKVYIHVSSANSGSKLILYYDLFTE